MKVLFAIGSAVTSEKLANLYFQTYGEKLEYKDVFYFKAVLEEVKRDKTYDRIVIAEELEPMQTNVVDAINQMLLNNLDSITDEIDDSPIIFICSPNRTKSDTFISRLFNMGIYNFLIGDDRQEGPLCKLIKDPRNKKEAKIYLNSNPAEMNLDDQQDDGVDERELISICNYFDRLRTPDEYINAFANVSEQYSDDDLSTIVAALSRNLKRGQEIFDALNAHPKFNKYCAWQERISIDNPTSEPQSKKPSLFGIFNKKKNKPADNEESKSAVSRRKPENVMSHVVSEDDQRLDQEAQLRAQQEAQLRAQQEAQLRAQQEAQIKAQQEAQLRAQQEELLRKQQEEQIRAQQEAMLKAQQEAQLKAQQEELLRKQQEEQIKAQQEAMLKAQQEAQIKAQQEELLRKQQEEQLKAQQEAQLKAQQEAALKQQQDDLIRAQQEAMLKAQQEAQLKAQQEAQLKAQQEAMLKAQQEAQLKAQQEAQLKAQQEAQLRAQQEAMLKAQEEERLRIEAENIRRQQEAQQEERRREALRREQEESLRRQEEELRRQRELAQQQINNYSNPIDTGVATGIATGIATGVATGATTYNTTNNTYYDPMSSTSSYNNVQQPEEEDDYASRITPQYVPADFKKVVAFVGPSKAGTSFIANCVGTLLAMKGIKTSILDMTKNRGLYWFYSDVTDKEFNTVSTCMSNLSNGQSTPIQVGRSKNLSLYTTVPKGREDNRKGYRHKNVIDTARRNCNLLIIDCDFTTPAEYLDQAQEIYVVQDLDLVKVADTKEYFKDLKARHTDWSKLKLIINQSVECNVTAKKIRKNALTYYQDPSFTYTEEFDTIKTCIEVPLEVQNYANYIDGMETGKLFFDKFTPTFQKVMEDLSTVVYGIATKKKGLFNL